MLENPQVAKKQRPLFKFKAQDLTFPGNLKAQEVVLLLAFACLDLGFCSCFLLSSQTH